MTTTTKKTTVKKENTEEMKTLKQTVQTDLFSIQKDFAEIINKRLSSPID